MSTTWPYRRETGDPRHRLEHRAVWEDAFGPIPPGYVVHHIDGNETNNALDNLQCMTTQAHSSIHSNRPPDLHRREVDELAYIVNACLAVGSTWTDIARKVGMETATLRYYISHYYAPVTYLLLRDEDEWHVALRRGAPPKWVGIRCACGRPVVCKGVCRRCYMREYKPRPHPHPILEGIAA